MKYTIRILAALLALMMCTGALVACSGDKDEDDEKITLPTESGSEGESGSDESVETKDFSSVQDIELPLPQGVTFTTKDPSVELHHQVSGPASSAECKDDADTKKLPADVNKGALVLVNPSHELVYDPTDDLLKMYENKQYVNNVEIYKQVHSSLMLNEEALQAFNAWMNATFAQTSGYILVSDAYRSFAAQQDIFEKALATYGADKVMQYAMKPNNSDFRAGYSVYLKYMPADKNTYALSDKEAATALAEINSTAAKNGFILRYPKGTSSITGVADTAMPYQYRYVGVAHATVMAACNLTLEEYIVGVKNYTSDSRLKVSTADADYHVFYVPAVADNATTILIPKNADSYSISGNNIDGFIVSVTFNKTNS